jgi:hypothetical protein
MILAGIAAAAGGLEIWLVIALGGIVYWRIAERSEAR